VVRLKSLAPNLRLALTAYVDVVFFLEGINSCGNLTLLVLVAMVREGALVSQSFCGYVAYYFCGCLVVQAVVWVFFIIVCKLSFSINIFLDWSF
jgi:hypothetical protein